MVCTGQLHAVVSNSTCLVRGDMLTFNPTPPAFRLMIKTFGELDGALNPATAVFLFFTSIDPSKRNHVRRSRSNTTCMRSKKLVNCEKTTARKHGS